jgi:hypothetical protein
MSAYAKNGHGARMRNLSLAQRLRGLGSRIFGRTTLLGSYRCQNCSGSPYRSRQIFTLLRQLPACCIHTVEG